MNANATTVLFVSSWGMLVDSIASSARETKAATPPKINVFMISILGSGCVSLSSLIQKSIQKIAGNRPATIA